MKSASVLDGSQRLTSGSLLSAGQDWFRRSPPRCPDVPELHWTLPVPISPAERWTVQSTVLPHRLPTQCCPSMSSLKDAFAVDFLKVVPTT